MAANYTAALLLIRLPLVEDALYDEHVRRCLWCYQPLLDKRRKRHAGCQQMYRAMYLRVRRGRLTKY